MIVVLPAPVGPTIATFVPASILELKHFSISTPLNHIQKKHPVIRSFPAGWSSGVRVLHLQFRRFINDLKYPLCSGNCCLKVIINIRNLHKRTSKLPHIQKKCWYHTNWYYSIDCHHTTDNRNCYKAQIIDYIHNRHQKSGPDQCSSGCTAITTVIFFKFLVTFLLPCKMLWQYSFPKYSSTWPFNLPSSFCCAANSFPYVWLLFWWADKSKNTRQRYCCKKWLEINHDSQNSQYRKNIAKKKRQWIGYGIADIIHIIRQPAHEFNSMLMMIKKQVFFYSWHQTILSWFRE